MLWDYANLALRINVNDVAFNIGLPLSLILDIAMLVSHTSKDTQVSTVKKKQIEKVYICSRCAKKKNLNRVSRIYLRPGKCSVCLEETFIFNMLDYLKIDATNRH